jgi:hypothetical protein
MPTGSELGGKRVIKSNGGTLLANVPGSNGGVHRGPDLVPRRDLVRRILERALWGTQRRAKLDPVTGLPAETGRRTVPTRGAMIADMAQRLQKIAEEGDDAALLRLVQLTHEIMQPAKGEGSGTTPRRVQFADAPSGLDQANPAEAPPGPEPATVIDREGNEYVQP